MHPPDLHLLTRSCHTGSSDDLLTGQISTLVGVCYSNEATRADVTDTISLVHPVLGPINIVRNTVSKNVADTYAAFGTMFWKPNSDWEVALGLRYDRENRVSRSAISGAILPIAKLKSSERSEEHTSELQSLMRISYAV